MTLEEFLNEWNDGAKKLLVHTSGSTGRPKPLWVEKRRMEASARITCRFLELKEGDTALLCMPLDFIAGKMMVVRALTCGLRLFAVTPTGHPLSTAAMAEGGWGETALDFVAMVPLQVWNSLQVPEERERLRSIRHLIIGGGAIDQRLQEQLADFPRAVWSTYGMTETLSHIALRRLNGADASEWYRPFEGVGVWLNEDSCLVIDAPAVCDGPLVTNDIAELQPLAGEGGGRSAFRIVGRRDNVVCSGGIKLQIEQIEAKLAPHLDKPFLLTKCKDERLGEALVMLSEDADVETLRDVCQRVLDRYEVPRRYFSVASLPLTPTGKPARAAAASLVPVVGSASPCNRGD